MDLEMTYYKKIYTRKKMLKKSSANLLSPYTATPFPYCFVEECSMEGNQGIDVVIQSHHSNFNN